MVNKYFFTASWCPNCQIVKPIIEELDVEIIDAGDKANDKLVRQYTILSLPAYIRESNDGTFQEMNGAKPKKIIEEFYE
ncbi:MAG: thioredoxin domain-containing protein [Candidatus Hodarchaeales archaeon]